MEDMNKLKEMLKKELAQYARRGELSAGSIEAIHKLTDAIKNIDKIEMLEEYGESDERYEGGSYRRGSINRYGRGESYKRDRYGRYSHDDGNEEVKRLAHEMMEMTTDDRYRDEIRHFIGQLDTL